MVLEVDLEHLIDEAVLRQVQLLHQICRDEGRKLESKVALGAALRDVFNRLKCEVQKLVKFRILGISDTLDNVASDAADAVLLELGRVASHVGHCDAAGEKRGGRILDCEVSQFLSKDFIGYIDAHETVIDKDIAAHHFVDKELSTELECGIARKNTLFSLRLWGGLLLLLDLWRGIFLPTCERRASHMSLWGH